MKTIIFCSYKGGTGKSLAAANLAVCLSRLKIPSALLEIEFGGPSLNALFPDANKVNSLVDHISSNVLGDPWMPSEKYFPWTFKTMNRFPLKPEPVDALDGGKDSKGIIHLIPSGNPEKKSYWENVLSPLWERLFSISYELKRDHLKPSEYDSAMNYFIELKKEISDKLEPKPQYLIVDLQSGSPDITTTIISAWAREKDKVVAMFSFNDISLGYMKKFLGQSEIAASRVYDIVPVLCRVPSGIDFAGDRKLKSTIKDINPKMKMDDLSVLYSDRDLEMMEGLRLGYHRKIDIKKLTYDYVKLFEKLINDDSPETNSENNKEPGWLRIALDLPPDIVEQDRIFTLEFERGALINPNDDSRNVSFKVETFQLLLKGLEEGISKIKSRQDSNEDSHKWFEELLLTAGEKCGEKFGSALANMWSSEVDIGEHAKLKKWCVFDSDVGFGKFVVRKTKMDDDKIYRAEIILRESFLTEAKDVLDKEKTDDKSKHKYCDWMTGYITGVVNMIFKDKIYVKHEEMTEGEVKDYYKTSDTRSESCIFVVSRTPFVEEREKKESENGRKQ